jgi:uncharacterized protein YgiM (DUF1202 family)
VISAPLREPGTATTTSTTTADMYYILTLALLAAAPALAQTTAYVSYDRARLYADADFLSTVIDTLDLGDSVMVHEREKKFARITVDSTEGWILNANLSDRPTKAAAKSAPAAKPAQRETSGAVCSATTKSGKQCSRKATSGSAYCWQHGK